MGPLVEMEDVGRDLVTSDDDELNKSEVKVLRSRCRVLESQEELVKRGRVVRPAAWPAISREGKPYLPVETQLRGVEARPELSGFGEEALTRLGVSKLENRVPVQPRMRVQKGLLGGQSIKQLSEGELCDVCREQVRHPSSEQPLVLVVQQIEGSQFVHRGIS